jgi:Ig-like domain-containing protein
MKNAMIFLVLVLLLAACTSPSTQAPAPTSERTLGPVNTLGPALSLTPTASNTPEPLPTLTPTFVFFLAPPTSTPAHVLDCKLLSQSVPNGAHFNPKDRFDVAWKVRNTGSADWFPGSIEFVFTGGARLHLSPVVHLQSIVASGDTIALDVDMVAPKNSTKYSTTWALLRGNESFCFVSLTIYVP